MALEDSYALNSKKEIVQLRKDVDEMKKKQSSPRDDSLKDSIERLTSSINEMLALFRTASTEIKAQPEPTSNALAANALADKMDTLISHNEDIAKAILLLLELSREHLPEISKHTKMSSAILKQRQFSQQRPQALPPAQNQQPQIPLPPPIRAPFPPMRDTSTYYDAPPDFTDRPKQAMKKPM